MYMHMYEILVFFSLHFPLFINLVFVYIRVKWLEERTIFHTLKKKIVESSAINNKTFDNLACECHICLMAFSVLCTFASTRIYGRIIIDISYEFVRRKIYIMTAKGCSFPFILDIKFYLHVHMYVRTRSVNSRQQKM